MAEKAHIAKALRACDYQPNHRFIYRQLDLTQAQIDFVHRFDSGDYCDIRAPSA